MRSVWIAAIGLTLAMTGCGSGASVTDVDEKGIDVDARMTEPPDLVFARGKSDLEVKTGIGIRLFRLDKASWNVDLDAGTITFNSKDRIATAPVQVIGTYNTLDGTFMWGWDHPSVPKSRGETAARVRAYGLKHKIKELTTRKISCTEADAWRFTGIATYLTNAQGGYRGPSGSTLVFMTFGTVELSAPPKRR